MGSFAGVAALGLDPPATIAALHRVASVTNPPHRCPPSRLFLLLFGWPVLEKYLRPGSTTKLEALLQRT
ncbi:hypothetical protein BRADI_1g49765v3 [Brachypodium distachyon]|uniref:Uncharacterized protein n=1 Tax=Brachypodium distachyon TaxID=15368 RepID=A0A0Q3NQ68_BRADI|nr:hypothetical protein BRADI_1g49765v3 [Brachypodium distachyon]